METNKKIITGVVGCVAAGILTFTFAGNSILGEEVKEMADGLEFASPLLDFEKFDNSTKKELYDKNKEYDKERYDSLGNELSFLQKLEEKKSKNARSEQVATEEENYVDEDLQMLLELQNSLSQLDEESLPQTAAAIEAEPVKPAIPQEGNYFFGASSAETAVGKNLIPAETIDQGIVNQGSTIAIRTKEPILLPAQNITIPKGAVVYGVATIGDRRLEVEINSYRRDNTLYNLNIGVHDFDGKQGIHLDGRTIYRIPANVSRDVFEYMYTRGTQSQSFVGNNRASLDEAKTVAIVSAAKEVSRELFDKRRVFVPRKYHLWLTVKGDDNGSN